MVLLFALSVVVNSKSRSKKHHVTGVLFPNVCLWAAHGAHLSRKQAVIHSVVPDLFCPAPI